MKQMSEHVEFMYYFFLKAHKKLCPDVYLNDWDIKGRYFNYLYKHELLDDYGKSYIQKVEWIIKNETDE